ncbi:MAG: hypothetical protein ACTHK9_00155 [Nitrobacter sp.]
MAASLALIGAFALDALWNAEAGRRKRVALGWTLFGVAALGASGVTPYGWGSLPAVRNILGLGKALSLIVEWRPADFSHVSAIEVCLLGLFGLALFRGVRLTPPRILLVLGLTQMALAHNRNIEVLAFLLPLVVAEPLSVQFAALRRTESRAISLSAAWSLPSCSCSAAPRQPSSPAVPTFPLMENRWPGPFRR